MVVGIFRVIGIINILFINFTEVYSVTADWTDNIGGWLWVILALSFIRELISIFATKVENLPRVVRGIIRSITVLATGCASSIAFIFPKLVYLESSYKDNIEIPKFKIKITRNYSVDELYDYLNIISVSNPIPVPIKMKISESAINRAQVRDLYEEQVELMRQLSEPIVVRPMHDLEVILNWCDEHVLYVQIGVAAVIAVLIIGFGYYAYTHPHIDYRDAAESLLEKSSGDTRDGIDNLRQAQSEANNLLNQLQSAIQKAESKLGASSVNQDIYERLTSLKTECENLARSIDDGAVIAQTEVDNVAVRLDKLDDKIDGVAQKALKYHGDIILSNVKRFTEVKADISSMEDRLLNMFDSDTGTTDHFAKSLDKLILSVESLQEHVQQHDGSLEKMAAQFVELDTATETKVKTIGKMLSEHRDMIKLLDKNMENVVERTGSLCALLSMALIDENALEKYKKFVEVYKKLGNEFLREDLNDRPAYIQFLQRVFSVSGKYIDEVRKK